MLTLLVLFPLTFEDDRDHNEKEHAWRRPAMK